MMSTQVQKGERDAGRDRLECPTRFPQTMEALATILDALGLGDIAEDRISAQKLKGDREAKKKAADTLRRSLARSAWRTVENFCNSADDDVKEKHVPRDVVRADDAFRSKHAPPSGSLRPYCSRWAKELYRRAADPDDATIACTQNVMQKVALKRLRQHPDEKLGWGWGGGPPPHVLLLDEAQDLDECILAVVDIQRKRGPTAVVLVGDPAQALYGFRGASADALRDTARFGEADTEFALARSFRFGPSIAREANRLLATKRRYDRTFSYTPVVGLGPKGSSEKDSVVKSWGESGLPPPPYAYICRSNRGAVDAAAKVCGLAPENSDDATFDPFAEDAAIAFAGDKGQQLLANQLRTLEDVADLRAGRPPESRAVRKWSSFPELERAVQDEDSGDGKGSLVERNVRDAFELCRRWGPQAGKLAAALRRAAQRGATEEGRRRAVVFTTSHKAKGLEWDTVVVHDDFAPFVDDLGDPVSFVHAEEINAWHVAVTRARRTLYVPPKLDALRAWCEQQDAAPGAPATPRPRGGLSLAALMGGGGMLSGTVSQSQRSVRRAGPDGW